MKKNYIQPSVKEIKIRMEQHVMAGSGDPASLVEDGTDNQGGKEDNGDFGW